MGGEEGEVEKEEDEAVLAAVVGQGERFEAVWVHTYTTEPADFEA